MPDFKMNDAHALDLLVFWVTGIDRDLRFKELKDVGEILEKVRYDPTTLGERTIQKLASRSVKEKNALINDAKQYAAEHFDHSKKDDVIHLLESLAKTDGKITDKAHKRLQELKQVL